VQSSSVSIDDARRVSKEALLLAAEEAGENDWDSFAGRPVTQDTVFHSLVFLEALPTTVVPPEISVHPDGEIGFFWTRGPRRTVAISVAPTGLLSFASLHGHSRLHGSEYLLNGLPSSIANVLRQLYADDA
jgi:hypothetical protein